MSVSLGGDGRKTSGRLEREGQVLELKMGRGER